MKRRNSKIKTGALSKIEKDYIAKYLTTKSDMEIGEHLNRATVQVEKYRREYLEKHSDVSIRAKERGEILEKLYLSTEWDAIKHEFTKEELILFESTYAEMMHQFKDVSFTEMEEVYSYIRTKIYIHRFGKEKMLSLKQIERIEKLLRGEYDMGEDYVNKHRDRITNMENELAALRNASVSKATEYKSLTDKSQSFMKSLKGTREQRIKKAEDAKQNITGLIKWLDEEENRRNVGQEMLLHEAAKEEEKIRLTDFHTYIDGTVDKPILLPE